MNMNTMQMCLRAYTTHRHTAIQEINKPRFAAIRNSQTSGGGDWRWRLLNTYVICMQCIAFCITVCILSSHFSCVAIVPNMWKRALSMFSIYILFLYQLLANQINITQVLHAQIFFPCTFRSCTSYLSYCYFTSESMNIQERMGP